jgi:hypothetical protein
VANRDRTAVETGLNDLLGNVIRTDRKQYGRDARTDAPAETPPLPVPQDNTPAPQETDIPEEEVLTATVAPTTKRRQPARPRTTSLVAERVEQAEEMASSPTVTVTLRIPKDLNDWLDEYVHHSWRQKLRKQGLVTEALQMLYARRGKPGEDILDTAFLGENEE